MVMLLLVVTRNEFLAGKMTSSLAHGTRSVSRRGVWGLAHAPSAKKKKC